MKCSTNNHAATVHNLFLEAVDKFGLLSRVRSDQGHKNVIGCAPHIEYRDAN